MPGRTICTRPATSPTTATSLTTYSNALSEEGRDLRFADFAVAAGPARPYAAPQENGAGDPLANPAKNLVELRGIEPLTLRLPA